jgi:transposase
MVDSVVPAQYRSRVQQRMAIVEYARNHGIKPASRHFGLARRTVRTWLRRWTAKGELGLVPQYPDKRKRRLAASTIELIRVARTTHQWGAERTRAWLERVYALSVNPRTIQRVFRDIGIPVLPRALPLPPERLPDPSVGTADCSRLRSDQHVG